jgi:hypothetical protein
LILTTASTTTTAPTTTAATTTTAAAAATTTTAAASVGATLQSSTLTSGQTVSGSLAWTLTTSGDVARAEFWANGTQLAVDSASPWTYQLATTTLPNGANTIGVALVSSTGTRSLFQLGTITVQNAPVSTSVPSISGTTSVGQTLTASTGAWTPAATSYAYRWLRCDTAGSNCAPIDGAAADTYAVVSADAGSTLRVTVTGTNAYGSSVASSAATAVVAAAPATATATSGSVLWTGDFETGTFSQYDGTQQYTAGRASVVTSAGSVGGPSAPRQGKDFFQCRVVSGDNLLGGERCEALKGNLGIANGADQYYGWSVAMPANLPANGLTGQFHSTYDYAQSNIQFFIDHGQVGAFGSTSSSPRWVIGVNGGPAVPGGQYVNQTYSKAFDLGLLSNWRGAGWIDVVVHVKWQDTLNGTVELWIKKAGDASYTKYVSAVGNVATLYEGNSAYLKLGLNRSESSGLADGYIFFDGVRRGTSFAAVDPAA